MLIGAERGKMKLFWVIVMTGIAILTILLGAMIFNLTQEPPSIWTDMVIMER